MRVCCSAACGGRILPLSCLPLVAPGQELPSHAALLGAQLAERLQTPAALCMLVPSLLSKHTLAHLSHQGLQHELLVGRPLLGACGRQRTYRPVVQICSCSVAAGGTAGAS